jgi:hypothetical protein
LASQSVSFLRLVRKNETNGAGSSSTPDPSRRSGRHPAVGDGGHDDRLVGEARARLQQPLQSPALAEIFGATERGDDLLAHHVALATVLDNLEIGATTGSPLEEKQSAKPKGDSLGWRAIQVNHNS